MSRPAKVLSFIAALLVMAAIAAVLLFPKIATWVIRTRVLPKVEKRLDRQLTVDAIKVGYGHATLTGVTVRGPADAAEAPLARVSRVQVNFELRALLTGNVRLGEVLIEEPRVELRRDAAGKDNFSDLIERLRGRGDDEPGTRGGGGGTPRPTRVRVRGGWVGLIDDQQGAKAGVDGIDLDVPRDGQVTAVLTGAHAEHRLGPHATVTTMKVAVDLRDIRRTLAVTLEGGSTYLWPEMQLTGIGGTVATTPEPGHAAIELRGGYGGVDETLWHAEGTLDLDRREGDLRLRADSFTLDKVAQVLAGTPIQNPADTSIDAALDLSLKDHVLKFDGGLGVHGLTVFDPWLAARPVRDLRFRGQIRGSYATKARLLTLDELAISFRGVDATIDGSAALVGGEDAPGLPRAQRRVHAHIVVPTVPCQQVLTAIPPELAPKLQGFQVKGVFDADVTLDIDWANLDELILDGSVGIAGCKVTAAPGELTQGRLLGEFQHSVEVEEGRWIAFNVGPSNPDFVPIEQVSPFLLKSLMTTEDSGFMKHHGFISREFRSALIKDLKEGYFKYGASSITMQLVKNVFLQREKTISRKLQELFLSWYIETVLPKDRLLEIYVNVIEFGPGLYGIGPAARHYFGKQAADINPVEAAFFSSILPNPKKRYMQYCEGELNRWSDAKVQRILKLMLERGRLTPEEYTEAMATPLAFDRTEALPEAECKKMTQRMIERTRPTQPTRRGG